MWQMIGMLAELEQRGKSTTSTEFQRDRRHSRVERQGRPVRSQVLTMRVAALALALALAGTAAPRPEFEAASIRLNVDGTPYVFNGMQSLRTFSSRNQSLKNLIEEAYGTHSGRIDWLPFFVAPGQGMPILGGPNWLSDRYDITAKWSVPPGEPLTKTQKEMNLMLQSLLEKRFALQLHRETRPLPIYEMTLTNTSKLRQASCVAFDPDNPPVPPAHPHYCGASGLGRKGRDWTLDGNAMRMSQLADTLSSLIGAGRTVVDKTGYKGTFDAHLQWSPDQGQFGATDSTPPPDDAGSIFSVLEQQLGLKLKTGTGPVEVLVIDQLTRISHTG
jgi:uncharacterized protein (TIGR03435 family)